MNNIVNPLISIVIPSYNHDKFIKKALDSVIDQTFQNWEAIVIDNHSTDETYDVLRKFNDPRFKFLKINNNGVLAKSRNLGIKEAKGEWIAFLDSDDWWKVNKLEFCLNEINEKVDLVYHDLEVVHKSKSLFRKKNYKGRKLKKPILKDLLISTIKYGNPIGQSSVLVRKSILQKIGGMNEDKSLVGSEDYNTWLRIARITDKFKYVNKKLGYYLIHNLSSQKRDLSIPHRHAIIEFMGLLNDQQKLNFEVKLKYMSGNYNTLENNYNEAKKDFMFVFKNGDINFKVRSLLKFILIMFK